MTICSHCHQKIRETHKEVLNKHKVLMLRDAAGLVKDTMVNDFAKSDLPAQDHSAYGNFQKLRYHGLITPTRDDTGNRIKGRWLITRNGWAFLRGELELPKFVLVRDNNVIERSPERIGIRQVYAGSTEVATAFEYFSEDGRPIGWKPAPKPNYEQAML